MNVTNETTLPSYDELTVPELRLTYPILKAASIHLGLFCENQCKEFSLCRQEERDPRKCLGEGKDVTMCGLQFFQKMKKSCKEEFLAFSDCVDYSSAAKNFAPCRDLQLVFDRCMEEKMNLKRPELGYFSRPQIHETDRPRPKLEVRDYRAEAAQLVHDLPPDYPIPQERKAYYAEHQAFDFPLFS